VLDVRHWTDAYFSFTTTRDDGFRFENGQFVMIGLPVEQPDGTTRPLMRAYSIASANWEEEARVLQHQGAGRAADLAPAAHPAGRQPA
jgi:ferredoxin-NADP reductase